MGQDGLKQPIFDPFAFGLSIGAVGGLVVAWVLDAEVANGISARWVEVVGIFAALGAAVIALQGVQRQINAQVRQAEVERTAQLNASLAVLPLTLMNISKLTEACFEVCLDTIPDIRNPEKRDGHLRDARIDTDSLAVLRDCIKSADPVSAQWLSLLIRKYQVCWSRFESFVSEENLLVTKHNQISMAVDWLVLRAIAHHLYEFSRMQAPQAPLVMHPETISYPVKTRHFGNPLLTETMQWLRAHATKDLNGRHYDYFP